MNQSTKIKELDISKRLYNCLYAMDVEDISEMSNTTEAELLRYRNFGNRSLEELKQVMVKNNINFKKQTMYTVVKKNRLYFVKLNDVFISEGLEKHEAEDLKDKCNSIVKFR